eukprot:331110-Rhodomonas_salina.1
MELDLKRESVALGQVSCRRISGSDPGGLRADSHACPLLRPRRRLCVSQAGPARSVGKGSGPRTWSMMYRDWTDTETRRRRMRHFCSRKSSITTRVGTR